MKRRDFLTIPAASCLFSAMNSCQTTMKPEQTVHSISLPAIQNGDTIGCLCTAGGIEPAQQEPIERFFQSQGYRVRWGAYLGGDFLYGLSGATQERLADLNAFIRDEEIKVIVDLSDGYGALPLLVGIDFDALRTYPKWFIGYSDRTVLHLAIYKKAELHSIMVTDSVPDCINNSINNEGFPAWLRFLRLSSMNETPFFVRQHKFTIETWVSGQARGKLIGGRVSRLAGLAGTDFAVPTEEDVILFLEESDEYAYRVDRCLTQLFESGAFSRVRGIVLGRFRSPEDEPDDQIDLIDVLRERFLSLNLPVLSLQTTEKENDTLSMVLGTMVELNSDEKILNYI
ncbi:MAG: LD-carboxypeptidase [Candidatus Omnitrophota bacterium]|jgi:muramoyltetrapeptide carboxypeptidase|nr:MAG: LD-carboxypeptidase [Candidatus Omnitrophota bacterium]